MNTFKKELHERALVTAKKFKRAEAELIQILQEVDQALLFLDFGRNITGTSESLLRKKKSAEKSREGVTGVNTCETIKSVR
jgi:hypothetical protein